MNFNDFALSDTIKRAVEELGYTEATAIQEKSIPLITEGKDVLGLSQTGSGKTAAYGLPILNAIDTTIDAKYSQALILCPTRELAMQVTEELRKFSKYIERMHIVPVYGGQPVNRQVALIRGGCQVLVGTPGRIIDLMNRRIIKFDHIKTVVLDEADEMLDMGFREDIEFILSNVKDDRQTVLFSATMPRAIIDITEKYQHDPVEVRIAAKQMTAVNIEQSFFEVARGRKKDVLSLLLQYYQPQRSLVFCNTKKMVDEVVADLKQREYSAEGLHGNMRQEQRTAVMNRFKNGGFEILVATDVAARGIDVNDIDIVFNYDLPDDCEYYVHRIGRTARAGKTGKSFTLIQGARQYSSLQEIAAKTKSTVTRLPLPTVDMIKNQSSDEYMEQILEYSKSHNAEKCSALIAALREKGLSDAEIAAAAVGMIMDEKSLKKGTVDVPEEKITVAEVKEKKRNSDNFRNRRREPNEKALKKFENVPMETVTISVGRKDKIAPKHILGAVAGESGLPGSIMGSIDIKNRETTVEVPKQFRTRIIKALNSKTIKGIKVTVK